MNVATKVDEAVSHACPALLVGCWEDGPSDPQLNQLDAALVGAVAALYQQREFTGKLNRAKLLHTFGRIAADRVVLVGLGKQSELTPDRLRQAAGSALNALQGSGIRECSSILHLAGRGGTEAVQATVEGLLLAGYAFDKYQTSQEENGRVSDVTILFPDAAANQAAASRVAETKAVCDAVWFARDLVSQPGNVATPTYLAERAREMAGSLGIRCTILEREEMERLGMGALLAVSRGSHQPPKFIVLDYRGGSEQQPPVVLVGKGITFDAGGISLKPGEGMEKMKDDMAGAAAVMGTMMAAATLELPLNLVVLVPAAENLPGGGAYKPGDVLHSMAGKTIEIVNTDAEGRLVLCDALHYAQQYRPAALIDVATLTGACVIALGPFASGVMGNDRGLTRELREAGELTGERLWELPLWEEYGELLKSDIADMKNAGGRSAGTISAGWFLKEFAGGNKWAHLDIAGTAWEEKGRPYLPKGATGVGVRLLIQYLRGVS